MFAEMAQEFKNVRVEMAQEFKNVRAEMAQGFKDVRTEIKQSEYRMTIKLGTIVSIAIGVAVTLAKLV